MYKHGFTLIEVLLSLVIITLLAGLTAPVYVRFQQTQNLDGAVQQVTDDIRRAQLYSRSGYYDSTWGVHVATGGVTLFRGTSFVGRNTIYDETKTLPGTVVISGLSDITFTKIDGQPSATGTITLAAAGAAKTLGVQAYGMVDF